VLAPLGFTRRGNVCTRSDELVREVRFHTPRWGDPDSKGVQVFLMVKLVGLPDAVTEFRRDALWTHLEPVRGLSEYPRPLSADPPCAELLADLAGPGVDFLCHASDLAGFVALAYEVHRAGGTWGPFRHVYPKRTAPLQAAAFAATLMGDDAQAQRAVAAVVAGQDNRRELRDFHAELARLRRAGP